MHPCPIKFGALRIAYFSGPSRSVCRCAVSRVCGVSAAGLVSSCRIRCRPSGSSSWTSRWTSYSCDCGTNPRLHGATGMAGRRRAATLVAGRRLNRGRRCAPSKVERMSAGQALQL